MQNVPYSPPGALPGFGPVTLERSIGPLQKLAFGVMAAYLFIIVSRMLDVVLNGFRIPLIVLCATVLCTIVAGNFRRVVQSTTMRILTGLLFWIGFTTVFSTWRSGSITVFTDCLTSFTFAVSILALTSTPSQSMRVMRVIGYGILVAALLSRFFGGLEAGRLSLNQGTYSDPNSYSMSLLLGLPYWMMMAKQANGVKKIFYWAGLLIIFSAFVRAGSRGGAIAFAVMMLVFFFQATPMQRLTIAVAAVLVIIGSALFLPSYLKTRYLTLFSADEESVAQLDDRTRGMLEGDLGSSTGRLAVLMDSIEMTMYHPFAGVGPGQFAYERWEQKRVHSVLNPGAIVTHNAYTQISSETGLPGLALLVALLVSCYKAIGKVLRMRNSKEYRVPEAVLQAGAYHRLSLTTLVVGAFFLSVAYIQFFWIVAAITAAYYHAVENSLPEWKVADQSEQTPPSPPKTVTTSPLLPALAGRNRLGGRP